MFSHVHASPNPRGKENTELLIDSNSLENTSAVAFFVGKLLITIQATIHV